MSYFIKLFIIKIDVLIQYIRDENNLNTIVNQTFDYCATLNGTNSNPFGKWVISLLDGFVAKKHLHACPYIRETILVNPVAANQIISSLLQGTYKVTARMFNKKDSNIITLQMKAQLR